MVRFLMPLFLFFLVAFDCVSAQETWVSRLTGVTDKVVGGVFSSSTDGWAIASGTTTAERLATTDSGKTWSATSDTSLTGMEAMYFYDPQTAWIVGINNRIRHTTNAGLSWEVQGGVVVARTLKSVHFANSNIGWAAGYSYPELIPTPVILKTQNGGNNWNTIYNPANIFDSWVLNDIFCYNQNTCWASGTNRLLRSTNGGTSWSKDTTNVTFNGTYFSTASTGWVVGLNGSIWKSTDGGVSWASHSVFGRNGLNDVFFLDSLNGWAVGQNGRIVRSTDGGLQWTAEASNTTTTLNHIFPGKDGSIWIAGENGTLLQSAPITPPPPGPKLTLSSATLDFGDVNLGQFRDTTIAISNTGDDTLVISNIASIGNAFTPRLSTMTLLPGESQFDTIRFTPSVLGQEITKLFLISNTAGGYDSLSLIGNSPLSQPTIIEYQLADQWNLLSLTLRPDDPRVPTLFPNAGSAAFTFDGLYHEVENLTPGKGYWIKFIGNQQETIVGAPVAVETIAVNLGWNLIGSYSAPIPDAQIVSVPPGIVTSQFFDYMDGIYYWAATLSPGKGHWVKCSSPGLLILGASSSEQPSQRIRIVPVEELPPRPSESKKQ